MRAKTPSSTLGREAAPWNVAGATGVPVEAATPQLGLEAVAGETGSL